jgi:hypothetical protein
VPFLTGLFARTKNSLLLRRLLRWDFVTNGVARIGIAGNRRPQTPEQAGTGLLLDSRLVICGASGRAPFSVPLLHGRIGAGALRSSGTVATLRGGGLDGLHALPHPSGMVLCRAPRRVRAPAPAACDRGFREARAGAPPLSPYEAHTDDDHAWFEGWLDGRASLENTPKLVFTVTESE